MGANNVHLIGRATNIPCLEQSERGHLYCKVRMAVKRPYKKRIENHDVAKETDFFNIIFYGKLAQYMAKNLAQGSLFYVTGRLQQDTWRDAMHNNRESVSVKGEKADILEPRRKPNPTDVLNGEFEDLNLVPRDIANNLFDREVIVDEDLPEDFL